MTVHDGRIRPARDIGADRHRRIVGQQSCVGLFSYFLLGDAYQSLALEVGFMNATTPVWVLLLGPRMGGGTVTAGMWWGLALAFAGTLLIISRDQLNALIHFHLNLGNLWSLLGAIAFAWFSIRVRAGPEPSTHCR